MMNLSAQALGQRLVCRWSTAIACNLLVTAVCFAQLGTLAEPFPRPADNAALHYQRGLLHLARVERHQGRWLENPVWESIPGHPTTTLPEEITELLSTSRHAVAAATAGSRTTRCDFGIDFDASGAGAQLPHVAEMVKLGRLPTLRGLQAEARGKWEEAAIIYFDGLRIGRHLTDQSTLLEALAGVEILRNNYFALCHWSLRCPSRLLVARCFGLLESMNGNLVNAPQVLAREASILTKEFQHLSEQYPEGDWARLVLDSYGLTVTGEVDVDRENAIAACVQRGVPAETFDSSEAFEAYLDGLSSVGSRYVESLAACMALPPKARLKRASSLNKKYSAVITILGSDTLIDAAEIGGWFAQHEAELALTRVVLALAAENKKGERFPDDLGVIAPRFGNIVPPDPYSGEAIRYDISDDGRSFTLVVPSLGPLDGVSFHSQPPVSAD